MSKNVEIYDAEFNLRNNLQEIQAMQNLLCHITSFLMNYYGDRAEIDGAANVLHQKLDRCRSRVWEQIGMLSPVSEKMRTLLQKKLEKYVKDKYDCNSLLASNWAGRDYQDEDALKELIQKKLNHAFDIREEQLDEVVIQVPKRNLEPDL